MSGLYRQFIPGFHPDGCGERASCATCRHFGNEPPPGKMPGARPESRKCGRPRMDKSSVEWRRPTDWCDQWVQR